MYRQFFALVFLALLIATFTRPQEATAQTREPFKVGFILSLSGAFAEYGEAQRNALELARAENPQLFSNTKFIYEDCQYLGRNAIAAFHKLRTQDKADLLFVWGVEPALILAPLAEMHKVPLLASAQLSMSVPERKHVVRTINYAEQYSRKLVEYMRSQGFKRIGIVKAELSFYNDRINGIRSSLNSDEHLEIIYELQPDQSDLNTAVSMAMRKQFDVLGLYLAPSQIVGFYKSAAEQRFYPRTFGSTPFESKRLVSLTGGQMVGAFFDHNDTSKEFHQKYLQKFNIDDQIAWAANAYDVANLIGRLFNERKHSYSTNEILEALKSAPASEGAGGSYKVSYQPGVGTYFNYAVVVKEISADSFDVIAR